MYAPLRTLVAAVAHVATVTGARVVLAVKGVALGCSSGIVSAVRRSSDVTRVTQKAVVGD